MKECLPIHPQPFEGESLTSWINRLASSNVYTVRQLLSQYLGQADWRHRDLDLLGEDVLAVLSRLGRVQGGTTKLRSMVLTPWEDIITQPNNAMDQKGWVCNRSRIRYCAICLSEDDMSHMRLFWRLHFLPICIRHGVVLHRTSANGSPTTRQGRPPIKPVNCSHLSQFSSCIARVLEDRRLPDEFGWPYSVDEFFLVLLALVRYLNLHLPRGPSWREFLRAHGLSPEPPFDWRDNDAVACVLVETAIGLIANWPMNIFNFVHGNQARLKRLCAEYGAHCPSVLKDLITKHEHTSNTCRSLGGITEAKYQIRPSCVTQTSSREMRVTDAVQYLLKASAPVSLRAVSKLARVGFQSLKSDATLRKIIQQGSVDAKLAQELAVQSAIKALHARELGISVSSVATFMGRSHRYLKGSPNLLSLVYSAARTEKLQ